MVIVCAVASTAMTRQPALPEKDELLHWIHYIARLILWGFEGIHHRLDWQREWIKEQQRRLP